MLRYFIIDDDPSSRVMLRKIITEDQLGVVISEAESGLKGLSSVATLHPDIVLIDLLMPELDGIETIEALYKKGFNGQFVMISEVTNKDLIGEAYEKGVEFFIHKPINRIEVTNVLKKVAEQRELRNSLLAIQESLEKIGLDKTKQSQQNVREIVLSILNDMGIVGEVGTDDILLIIEYLMNQSDRAAQIPPLKDLYEAITVSLDVQDLKKESKAIEQRIRRTIVAAINNLANMGLIDYTNPEFEYYAPRYFDFHEVRKYMQSIQEGKNEKTKINIKKFIQVLYLETIKKMRNG